MFLRFLKDLSLIEIIVAFLVITMFVLVIALNYSKFTKKAIESEVKFGLKEIYAAQELYFEENGVYAKVSDLNQKKLIVIKQDYYDYEDAHKPNNKGFKVIAIGKPGTLVEKERWSIDEKHKLEKAP